MVLDISLVSDSCFHSCLLGGALVLVWIHSSCDSQAGYHVHIGQSGDIGPWLKMKAFAPLDQKWEAAIKRLSFLGVSAGDNSKQWEIRRLSQFFVLGLSSSSTLLYQFRQPAIGGRGQFLKVSCYSWGFVSDVLKGILWDSAAMNSEGSEIPTGPRK
jgi:hypothetical protein